MASSKPLQGTELIDCAKANAKKEIEVVSERCGYGEDIAQFEEELKKACDSIGIEINDFEDLKTDESDRDKEPKIEIAPETPTQF